jgi:tRNA modification GTPase
MPAPRSYTGEDVVELHLPGSPLLLDEVARGFGPRVRLATPGEFTRRAFDNRRIDLAEAEAVAQLIHAADEEESRFALGVLRGGLADAVASIRQDLLDCLGLIEAGLDFTDGETGAVSTGRWSPILERALRSCGQLYTGLPATGIHGEILLLGAANAGKSSLANALFGRSRSLVAGTPGTTRDVLEFQIAPGLKLLDGPGDLPDPQGVDRDAIVLRDRLAQRVAGVISVVDLTDPCPPITDLPVVARVFTKVDLQPSGALPTDGVPNFVVSSTTGAGVQELRSYLLQNVSGGPRGLTGRLHQVLTQVEEILAGALEGGRNAVAEELIAVDLRDALDGLESIHGRWSPEDVLDRIFAGFCLGK